MSLPSLFLKETTEGDVSQTKLPQDMDLWAETIVTKIREKIPGSRHMVIKVMFQKKNEELGIATGAAVIHDQKLNKAISIPLIVKNFALYPLDIMMVPKKDNKGGFEVMPFSPENFAEALFNSDAFDHLERPIDRIQQMYLNPQNSIVYPPSYRNVYASANSMMLDAISDTILPQDKEAFLNTVKASENTIIGYEKRANLDLLKKIAGSKVQTTPQGKANLKNISLLKVKGSGSIQAISTSDEVFDPIIEDSNGMKESCSSNKSTAFKEETLNEVRRNGEKIVFNALTPKEDVMLGPNQTPGNYTRTEDKSGEAKVFGAYKVQDKNGVFHTGVIIPNIINFDAKKVRGQVFYSQNKSSFQDKIVGIPSGKEKFQFLEFRTPSIGATGVFVTSNDTNAIATIPVTIRSMAEIDGEERIVAMDLNGRKVKIKYGGYIPEAKRKDDFAGGLKTIVKVKDYYVMPSRFKFLPMDNFCSLMETSQTMSLKIASKIYDANPIRIIHTGDNQFSLKGPDMQKMAQRCGWNSQNLSASQSVFLLTSKKCPLDKVAGALKMAGSHLGESLLHGLPRTKYVEDISPQTMKLAQQYVNRVRSLRVNLVKEAAGIEDSQVVDAALSLNFINPDNIEKFIGFVPLLEQASKVLAQTLLASRLGMQEIPEYATASAMHKIMEVIEGLKKLKSLEEKTAGAATQAFSDLAKASLSQNAGKYMAATGLFGLYAGSEMSKKKNYKRGFGHGAVAMRNHMTRNTQRG